MTRPKYHGAIAVLFVAACFGALLSTTVGASPTTVRVGNSISATPPASNISIVQTPSGVGGVCLPPFLALRNTTKSDATTFRLRIIVSAPLCQRVNVVAAIYAMPGKGVAWPQNLVETAGFTLKEAGVTEVTFTKTCAPVQFDVITGSTPQVIAPWGQRHGPLLFPFDTSTSLQFWGCGGTPTTTTTTSTTSTTTTTIADNCDDYTPTSISATPNVAAPGQTIAVAGTGTPGTAVQVLLRPAGTTGFTVLSDPALVSPTGAWSTTIQVPASAAPGQWTLAAQAIDCETEVTTEIQVTSGSTPPTTPPVTIEGGGVTPEVAGEVLARNLPAAAVSASGEDPQVQSASASAAGLAFTGTSVHLPVTIGVLLLTAGGLFLLRSRRRHARA